MNGKARMVAAAAAVALAAAAALSGCDTSSGEVTDESGATGDRFVREGRWRLIRQTDVITDERTGVQYLIVESFENDVTVCPLLNADGTPCTEEDE